MLLTRITVNCPWIYDFVLVFLLYFLSIAIGQWMYMWWHESLLTMTRYKQTPQDAKHTDAKLFFIVFVLRIIRVNPRNPWSKKVLNVLAVLFITELASNPVALTIIGSSVSFIAIGTLWTRITDMVSNANTFLSATLYLVKSTPTIFDVDGQNCLDILSHSKFVTFKSRLRTFTSLI